MISSQDKDNTSTQPFSTSSMDLFASPQGLGIEKRKGKRKKNHKLLSPFEIYIDVAEDPVNECLSKSTKEQQKKSTLQEFDESEVHAHGDQEQRHAVKKKKRKHKSTDMGASDVNVSGDLDDDQKEGMEVSPSRNKIYADGKISHSGEESKCATDDVHNGDANTITLSECSNNEKGKKKKRKHNALDMDVCDVNVSGDLNEEQNGGVEVNPSENEIYADGKKGHTATESKCASDDVHNDDANTITLNECSNSGKGKKKERKLKSEVNILSENKIHLKSQESCKNHTSQCDELCLTENNEETHRSEQVDPVSVCESLEMTHNEQVAKCGGKKKSKTKKLNKHIEEIKLLNEWQGFDNRQCYLCEVSVAGKNNYIKHLATAHDKHVFQCSQCGRCCTSREGLSLHQSSVCGQEKLFLVRIFKCKECPMSYKNNRSLRRHNKEQHNIGSTVKEHVCQRCNKSFTRQASVQIHLLTCMKRKENSGEDGQGEVSCKECQKVFSSKRSLRYHISTIHEQRQFECSTCGEVFRWSKSLSKHRPTCQNKFENNASIE